MINKQILSLFRITNDDYLIWCSNNNLSHYLRDAKKNFFNDLLSNFLK